MPWKITAVALAALAAVTVAFAQDAPADDPEGADTPYMMTDRDGRAWECRQQAGVRSCIPAGPQTERRDDRTGGIGQLDLERRVEDLERRLAALEQDRHTFGPDDERKLDRFLDFSDKAFRRFFGMVEDLRTEFGDGGRI